MPRGTFQRRDAKRVVSDLLEKTIPHPDGCWRLNNNKRIFKHDRMKINGKFWVISRVMYELFIGPIPKGLCACHDCDNMRCVNPYHCFLGTKADNNADCRAKGRYRCARGEDQGGSILKNSDVLEARQLYATGHYTYQALADKKGVCVDAMWKAVTGRSWKHL